MKIDLNSDLGESTALEQIGYDKEILHCITSANIACGYHAGDESTMRRTVAWALEYGVTIGAHISYDDRENFGRRDLDVDPGRLTSDIVFQLESLCTIAAQLGARVEYVKPHGSLYTRITKDEVQARAVVKAIKGFDSKLALLTMPYGVAAQVSRENHLIVFGEAYSDRAYDDDGGLVPRSMSGSVISEPDKVCNQALSIVKTEPITTYSGNQLRLSADSISLHSDTPGAMALARQLKTFLEEHGVLIESFIAGRQRHDL